MVIVISVILIYKCFSVEQSTIQTTIGQSIIQPTAELTLIEAVTIGLNKAKEWNKKASLMKIISEDEKMGETKGENGKRYKWNLYFTVSGTGKYVVISILNGKATTSETVNGPKNMDTFNINDIRYDSSVLLQKAKEKYDLQPGKNWATGYHFSLDFIEGTPTITIVSLDKEEQFTKVYYDSRSGEEIDAQHKVADGGGIMGYKLETKYSNISHKSMAVKGVSTGDNILAIWGDRRPTEFNFATEPFIEISEDNGESWTSIDFKEYINKAWFSDQKKLYIATDKEIFTLGIDKSKNLLLSMEQNIEGIDYTVNGNISISTDQFTYVSKDYGLNWTKGMIPESASLIQINSFGQTFLATKTGKILMNDKGDEWTTITTPSDMALKQIQIIKDNILCIFEDESLRMYDLKQKKWDKLTIKSPINSILKDRKNFFTYSEDSGVLSLIINGGDAAGWTLSSLYRLETGYPSKVEILKKNLFIASIPNYLWKPLK